MTFKDGADQNRLRTLGKRVPEEIFVAGFSGTFARFFCKKKERLKRQKIAFVLSFKWLWQSLALVGSDKEMRKKQIREVETLSNHYPMETP